jgi:hypothetical protein
MRTPKCTILCAALAAFIVICALAAPAAGQLTWYAQNIGEPIWGPHGGANPDFWEPMDVLPYFGPECSFVDLDPENPYFAFSGGTDRIFRNTHFWAELWLANNFIPVVPRQVDVELWLGGHYNPVVFVASASVMVTNAAPAQQYIFDFGAMDLYPATASIILKIIYYGPLGDTHIYWASESCPTGLYSDAPVPVKPSTWGKIKALFD